MVSVCATCKGLQNHLKPFGTTFQDPDSTSSLWVNTTLPSLRHSTNAGGCRACALLLQGILLHHDRFAGVREESVRIKAECFGASKVPDGNPSQGHLSVEVRWKGAGPEQCDEDEQMHDHDHHEGYPDLKIEYFTDQVGQSPFSAIGGGRHISENPLQDSGLSTIRRMINNCLSVHSKCKPARPTTLPKRVLDVLLDDGSKGVKLREVEFNTQDQRYEFGEYCTLSHCWGTGRTIPKTTSSTLEANQKNIPWSTLPRTFQDAVSLTRALGFRWLWIDSLCIVQDDAEEKLNESFRVDEIFRNAFLTIAATSAVESTDGLFLPKTQPFKIQATDSKGSVSKIYVREQPSHYSFKAPFDSGAHMNDWELPFNPSVESNLPTPLLKRAWAYAERLLSPRVLHFTKSEMILECSEGYQCECGRIDDPTFDSRTTDSVKQEFARIVSDARGYGMAENGNNRIDNRADSLISQLAATSLADATSGLSKIYTDALQLWSYIITEYTSRNLTYDVDRLVAIVGVAKTLSEVLQSGYIAGQWTFSTLGLLWYPNDGSQCRRPKTNVPSWSWASVEGSPIFFDNSTAMDLACKASFLSEQQGSGPAWSPVEGDTLELKAAMATEVQFRIDNANDFSLVKNGVSVEFRPDVSPPRGEDTIAAGETLVCVLVSMTFRSSIIGLVLKKSNSDPRIYRRVGRFECYDCQRDESDDEPEDAESLFSHWFPEIEDMTQLDERPQQTLLVV